MSYAIRLFGLLLVLIAFYAAGTFMFTKGFLLKRAVLEKKSSCGGGAGEERDGPAPRDGCWTRRRFRRAVVLLIDALRFDFMAYRNRTTKEAEGSPPYLNKLPAISERLTERPGNALLFRFLADPPTTTLQRLKGLTTGSLPTFVDMGSNFARAEITEDNIVDQLVRNGKKIVFLGDDTWTGLFPGRFFKSFPYPSFNVRDLHTVDDGILQHLIPEMSRAGWDVIIAHFLGVDHCGHRFGPNHVAMSDKLTQMNQMLRSQCFLTPVSIDRPWLTLIVCLSCCPGVTLSLKISTVTPQPYGMVRGALRNDHQLQCAMKTIRNNYPECAIFMYGFLCLLFYQLNNPSHT